MSAWGWWFPRGGGGTPISGRFRGVKQLPRDMAVALLAIGLLVCPTGARSAEPFKAGDEVDVRVFGRWWPGVVVECAKGQVLVDYEARAGVQRRTFKVTDVRLAYAVDALSKPRYWTDRSGTYRTRAVLLSIAGQRVTLRKPDMTEVEVPIGQLSDGDQRFIARLQKEGGTGTGAAPQPPDVEQFAEIQDRGAAAADGTTGRAALTPDPIPAYLRMKHAGAAFPAEDMRDRVGAVLPVGGPEAWLLAAVERGGFREDTPTRLLWASLAQKKIKGRQLLPPGEIVLDYHPPSHRLLTYALVKTGSDPRGTAALTLWDVLPSDGLVQPVVRWNAEPSGGRPHDPWARLVDGNVVLHQWTRHEFVAWDAAEKRMRYPIAQESFSAKMPTLSGGRKYLFVPEDKQVRVLEAATGRLASTLPADDGASAVAISEDGRWAAVLGSNALTIWDLTSADAPPYRYQAEAIGTPFTTTLRWVGDRRLMVDAGHAGLVLFSLPRKVPLWNYKFDLSAVGEGGGRRVREIVDGHLVYAASFGMGRQRGLAVGAVKLPGPKVDEAAATFDPESLILVKPGTEVQLDVIAGDDSPRVRAALQREIEANGWKLTRTAPIVVVAEMKVAETQQVTYRHANGPDRGREETVSVTPHVAEVRVEVDGERAWQESTRTGAPPRMRLREGDTVQGEISRWQRPQPEFFETLDVPERLLDPKKRYGLGTTQVTNRGLVPVETTPKPSAGAPAKLPPAVKPGRR